METGGRRHVRSERPLKFLSELEYGRVYIVQEHVDGAKPGDLLIDLPEGGSKIFRSIDEGERRKFDESQLRLLG